MKLTDIDDAEKFQKHFVLPLVDAVRAEVKPLVEQTKANTDRIDKLEGNQKKALAGYAVLSVIAASSFAWAKQKVMSHFTGK